MIRVLVVDDSALIRRLLSEMLDSQPDIQVVGTARDPYDARDQIKARDPDVLTLDVEMPRMDGIAFLRNLMRLRPMPVVMVSSLTEAGGEITLDALALGAVDFVTKPRSDVAHAMTAYTEEIADKVRVAARAQVRRLQAHAGRGSKPLPRVRGGGFRTTDRLIAIGASTGGTEAIRMVLEQMPPDCPGIVIAQHIPGGFSRAFARRMDEQTGLSVFEARDGQRILPGHAYIAPGDHHLEVARDGARYVCRLSSGEPVNRHRPSVDVLFHSVANQAGRSAAAALLTGMGRDGAEGLMALHEAGAWTVAQDEASSVVWGMPGEAVRLGAARAVLPLEQIAPRLLSAARGTSMEEQA